MDIRDKLKDSFNQSVDSAKESIRGAFDGSFEKVKEGIDSISVTPDSVLKTLQTIASIENEKPCIKQ